MFVWQRSRYAYLEDEYKVSDELLLWCLWWCWPHPRDRLLLLLAGSSRQVSWHLEGCPPTPVNLSVLEYGRVGTRSIKDEDNVKLCWKQQNIKPTVAEPEPGLLGRLLRLLFFFLNPFGISSNSRLKMFSSLFSNVLLMALKIKLKKNVASGSRQKSGSATQDSSSRLARKLGQRSRCKDFFPSQFGITAHIQYGKY